MTLTFNATLMHYWKKDQETHDRAYHTDIYNRTPQRRLAHAALHFAKYLERFEETGDIKPDLISKTLADVALMALGAANAKLFDVQAYAGQPIPPLRQGEALFRYLKPTARFANAVEKMDHAESGGPDIMQEIFQILCWLLAAADHYGVDLDKAILARRKEIWNSRTHIGLVAIA